MQKEQQDYSLFFKFIEAYSPEGFLTIKESDSLMQELEELMDMNNQFFFLADLLKFKILYTSKRSLDLIGFAPKDFDPQSFLSKLHPDEFARFFQARAKLIKISEELLSTNKKQLLFSTNFKSLNNEGNYTNLLHQALLFYCDVNKSVYILKIHTNIDWYLKIKREFNTI